MMGKRGGKQLRGDRLGFLFVFLFFSGVCCCTRETQANNNNTTDEHTRNKKKNWGTQVRGAANMGMMDRFVFFLCLLLRFFLLCFFTLSLFLGGVVFVLAEQNWWMHVAGLHETKHTRGGEGRGGNERCTVHEQRVSRQKWR